MSVVPPPRPVAPAAQPRLPLIIQGGMGVGVSGWRLARSVAAIGQLGVVSGVALDVLLARRLQHGDPGGDLRRALAAFPHPGVADKVLSRYFVPGGIAPDQPYRPTPRLGVRPSRDRAELTAAANFVEVFLAKEGHDGLVGVNYLEKIQMATPAAVYGAMLAGADYVLVGAGIPAEIPRLLDSFAAGLPGEISITVAGADADDRHVVAFDPAMFGRPAPELRRPMFLAIVSSAVLAGYLARSEATRPDGFVLETEAAGGHSAPPRGRLRLDEGGEPVYGPRDQIDLSQVAALGLPFWLAGGYASPEGLAAALTAGAAGVQVGTAFALSRESGLEPALRRQILAGAAAGGLAVRNDPRASPTGFPFKVARLPGTLSDPDLYASRPRLCDLGYLRSAYRKPDGSIGYRCPGEPVDAYVRKGGEEQDAAGRQCLCNGLLANLGLGQRRPGGYQELPLLTLGKDTRFLAGLPAAGPDGHSAADVVRYLFRDAFPVAGQAPALRP